MIELMENNNIAKPLLKWPGGKRRVLKHLQEFFPEKYDIYVEPFVGGGAVFFNLQPERAVINDYNGELINVYRTVKEFPAELIKELKKDKYSNDLENFLFIRALDRDEKVYSSLSQVEKAARSIYLNRTCFNGLYRVNSKNQFNVPFGKYNNPRIVDEDNIYQVHELFSSGKVQIFNGDYSEAIKNLKESNRNFFYFDPPYVPLTPTASFVSYTDQGFDIDAQIKLRDIAHDLDIKGNYVMLSNSDTPIVRELYKDFSIVPISVARSVGAQAQTRVNVGEVIILGSRLAEEKKEILNK